jgi:hypothetical protein
MSAQGYGTDITLLAGADLSTKQHYAVKVDATGKAVLAALGEHAIGVLQNKPGNGQAATIRILGATKMVAGGAVAAGALVTPNAAGKGAVAGAGNYILGVALTAAGQDLDVHEVLLKSNGKV